MADTKSQLNDIVLDKDHSTLGGFKKILLTVATFAVLLIIVIVIMSSLNNSDDKQGLGSTILPPEPTQVEEEKSTLFKSVEVINEQDNVEEQRLEDIALEIKEKTLSKTQTPVIEEAVISDPYEPKKVVEKKTLKPKVVKKVVTKKPVVKKTTPKVTKTTKTKVTKKGSWFVQVGSFEKPKPNNKLISKIKSNGYSYKIYKSKVKGRNFTKVLVGPFSTYREAQKNKPKISKTIQSGAFIYQVVQ